MEEKKLQIRDIYNKMFPIVTQKITGIEIKEVQSEGIKVKEPWYVYIKSRGKFQSVLMCMIEKDLKDVLLCNMNHGKELSEEVKGLYLGEYVNIICGHALTYINNIIGSSSMLTVPKVLMEPLSEEINFSLQEIFCFESQHGIMKIKLQYEIEE